MAHDHRIGGQADDLRQLLDYANAYVIPIIGADHSKTSTQRQRSTANPAAIAQPPRGEKQPHMTWNPSSSLRFCDMRASNVSSRCGCSSPPQACAALKRSEQVGRDALDMAAGALSFVTTHVIAGGRTHRGMSVPPDDRTTSCNADDRVTQPWRVGRIVRSPISTSSGWSITNAIARATAVGSIPRSAIFCLACSRTAGSSTALSTSSVRT
jgi:hypothetical protein